MNIIVIGMGYVGISCAALLADVEGFQVTGVQRRSERSGWKIECLNNGECPFDGDEPGLDELINRAAAMLSALVSRATCATKISILKPYSCTKTPSGRWLGACSQD